jgi:hypothetical protein
MGMPLVAHDVVKAFAETVWLANAMIGGSDMARVVNARFSAAFVRVRMCRLRNELCIRWRPPPNVQLLTEAQEADAFPVVSNDSGVDGCLSAMHYIS